MFNGEAKKGDIEGGLSNIQVPLEWLNRRTVVHGLITVVPTDSRNVAVLCIHVEFIDLFCA